MCGARYEHVTSSIEQRHLQPSEAALWGEQRLGYTDMNTNWLQELCTCQFCIVMQIIVNSKFENSGIFSQVKLRHATLQFGLWAAADDMKHYLMFATLTFFACCKAPLLVAKCAVTLVSPKMVYF